MRARDLMTGNPVVVTPGDPVQRAAELMRDRNIGSLPVVSDHQSMNLCGIVTDRDLAVRCLAVGLTGVSLVGEIMTSSGLDTIGPDADHSEVLALMKRNQVRRIPVVDDTERIVGIIAQADLAVRLGPRIPHEVESVLERISEPGRRKR